MQKPPEKKHPLLIRLTSSDIDVLQDMAEKMGTRRAILIRTAVKEFLNRRKKDISQLSHRQ